MLTNEDIQKIINIVATKEDIKDLKEDVSGLRESVQSLILSTDRLIKSMEDLHQEFIATVAKIDRHEKWIHQLAEKLGVQLKY